jgi:hypothetical protein
MVGKDDPGVDAEGRVEPHLPKSVPQHVNLRHQQVRATGEQVDGEEERSTRNPIAAIVRHATEYASENGGMRSRFSTLRLLHRYCVPRPSSNMAGGQSIYGTSEASADSQTRRLRRVPTCRPGGSYLTMPLPGFL